MKAKELAKRFNDSPTHDTMSDIVGDFHSEIFRLRDSRNIKTDAALFSILDELNQKFEAFARLVKNVRSDGFVILLQETMPSIYDAWRNSRRKVR